MNKKFFLTGLDLPWTICTAFDQEAFERTLWRERSGWQSVWAKPLPINLRIFVSASCQSTDHSTATQHWQLRHWVSGISRSQKADRKLDYQILHNQNWHIPLAKKSLLLWNCWNQRVPVGYVAMARNDGAQTSGEKDWEIQLGWERCDRHVYCTTVDSRWHISFLQVYDTRPSRNTSWSTDIRQEQLDTLDMHV